MNDNYKFLGTISAVYAFANADENYYITLVVFNNANNLKIYYKDLAVCGLSETTKDGEIILDNISEDEFNEFVTNFNKDMAIRLKVLYKFFHKIDFYFNGMFEIIY